MPARGEEKTVGGKTYEWTGRRWVPATEQTERKPISTIRSRYSQGAPRPARAPETAEEQVQTERTGRAARRGSGVRGRGPEQPLSFSPAIGGRSGAQRAKTAATAQPPVGQGSRTSVGGKTYNMDDPDQVQELNQVLAANQAALGNPKSADIRGGGGERADGNGRHNVRIDAYGQVQSGTLMGSRAMTMEEANKLLGRQTAGYSLIDPFASNQLPASASDLYGTNGYQALKAEDIPENMFSVRPVTMGKNLDMDMGPFETGAVPENYMSGVEFQSEMLRGSPNIVQGGAAETAAATTSATDTPKSSIPSRPRGGRQAEMWDRKYGRLVNQPERENSDLEKGYKPDLARRAAFLDGNMNSMQALRAIEAQKGIFLDRGKYNMVNPNRGQEGESDFMKIGKAERDAYMGGRKTAQQVRDTYVDKIKAANAGQNASAVTPADMP